MPKESRSQADADRKERASWDEYRHENFPSTKRQQRAHDRARGRGR